MQIDSNINNSNSPHIAPDVNNGIKIFWTNNPANREYMQQLDNNGMAQLPGIGVAVSAENHYPSHYQKVLPASNNHDIILLRLNGTGLSFAKYVPLYGGLTLTIISFYGVNKGAINVLNWQTSRERNTGYFSIERSDNGNHFAGIGKVAAKNVTLINNYNYEDVATSNTDVYYRLKETDKDGKVTYSSIIDIHQTLTAALHIFPNPAINTSVIYLNAMAGKNSILKVFDISGKQIKQVLLNAEQSSVTIDVSSFSAGTYFCKLQAAGKMFIQKLIVVK